MATEVLDMLRTGVYREFHEGLLPFWRTQVLDYQHGGFIGRMSNDLTIDRRAPKGLILNTRLLWTYSALFRYTEDDSFLTLARRAYEHLNTHFLDDKFGGAFWFIDAQGTVLDGKKKTYGHAFFVYALVEYVLATQDKAAEKLAIDLFNIVEQHTYDSEFKGYFETFERNWSEAEDARLSSIDMNEKKSMNNHLHILEWLHMEILYCHNYQAPYGSCFSSGSILKAVYLKPGCVQHYSITPGSERYNQILGAEDKLLYIYHQPGSSRVSG